MTRGHEKLLLVLHIAVVKRHVVTSSTRSATLITHMIRHILKLTVTVVQGSVLWMVYVFQTVSAMLQVNSDWSLSCVVKCNCSVLMQVHSA